MEEEWSVSEEEQWGGDLWEREGSSALGQQYLLHHRTSSLISCENGSLLLRCWECFSLGVYFVCNFVSQQCVCIYVCVNLKRDFKCLYWCCWHISMW